MWGVERGALGAWENKNEYCLKFNNSCDKIKLVRTGAIFSEINL